MLFLGFFGRKCTLTRETHAQARMENTGGHARNASKHLSTPLTPLWLEVDSEVPVPRV
jgi:hypothetical protein